MGEQPAAHRPAEEDVRFGAVAVRTGFLTRDQVVECLRTQERMKGQGKTLRIGQIMLKRGLITTEEYVHILAIQGGERPAPISPHSADRLPHLLESSPTPAPLKQEGVADDDLDALFNVPSEVVDSTDTSMYIGKYRVLETIGKGGMGKVFKVHDPDLDKFFACKAITPRGLGSAAVERFRQEARILARLNHPNVVRVHYFDTDRRTYFLIMDLVEGKSLQDYFEKSRVNVQAGAAILWIIARALHHVHAHGIVHRDVKPSNIVLVDRSRPVLIDFGLSHVSKSDIEAIVNEPPRGLQVGTPHYMAPEQIGGHLEEIDARTDVYALGVGLYRLLTGNVPYDGDTAGEIFRKALKESPKRPREVNRNTPVALELACMKAMSKRRIDRFSTAGEFADAIRTYLGGDR